MGRSGVLKAFSPHNVALMPFGFLPRNDTDFRRPFGHSAAFPAVSGIRQSGGVACSHGEIRQSPGYFLVAPHPLMARGFGNAGAARYRRAWHRWRQVEILPRKLQTSGVAEFCLQAIPHADSALVPLASALPAARPDCTFVPSVQRAASDRASVVLAASCPFAVQNVLARVASFPRRQSVEWRHEVPGVTGVVRFSRV